jgi:peptidoglycan-N-acetylglucosamine deacetylase
METPATPDEAEPASFFKPTFAFILFLSLLACTDSGKKTGNEQALLRSDTGHIADEKKPLAIAKKKTTRAKKKIYLTFDDGPNKGTKNVLDIVQEENIPVTFFIVGEHVFASHGQRRDWKRLITAENIEICNHSYTHAHNRYDRFYELPETVVKDMEKAKESFLPATNIVRAPGRNSWRIDSLQYTDIQKSKLAMDSLQKAGFIVMGWDLEWHYDPKTFQVQSTADEMLTMIDSAFAQKRMRYPNNLVLLAHDQVYHRSADSLQLRTFIQKLKSRDDYELSLVSAYPAIRKHRVVTDTIKTFIPPADTIKPLKADTL